MQLNDDNLTLNLFPTGTIANLNISLIKKNWELLGISVPLIFWVSRESMTHFCNTNRGQAKGVWKQYVNYYLYENVSKEIA